MRPTYPFVVATKYTAPSLPLKKCTGPCVFVAICLRPPTMPSRVAFGVSVQMVLKT